MPSWQSVFSARMNRLTGSRRPDIQAMVGEVRSQYERLSAGFGAGPSDAAFEPTQLGQVKGEWVRTAASDPGRLIVYFHGGGHVAGSPQSHRPLVARLCQAGQSCGFSLAYRKAPEFPFPAGLRDAMDIYRYLLGAGFSASSLVLAGDEAGGGIAFACALAIRNAGLPMPAAIVAMSPWADMSLSGWSLLQNAKTDAALSWNLLFVGARCYLNKSNPTDPYASPVYANFHDFPPIMVHAGSTEVLRDDASRLGDCAAKAGVPVSVEIYDGMPHLFQASSHISESRVSLMRLGNFIKTRTQATGATRAQAASGSR